MSTTRLARTSRVLTFHSTPHRNFHSYHHPPPPSPFNTTEETILRTALTHVPLHGFTPTALAIGAKEAGYLDASATLFPHGPFALVHYHLVTQRLQLAKHEELLAPGPEEEPLGVAAKVRALTWERLLSNRELIARWQEALALMALPGNLSVSLQELAALSDEIWILAGDASVDTSWYTRRASLSAIYASADLFMTTDRSKGFLKTKEFLGRRFEDSFTLGTAWRNTSQWIGFTAGAGINVLRSKGIRI